MSFKLRYWAELRSKFKEVFWRVEIAERGYSGSSEEMSFDGSSPLQITWSPLERAIPDRCHGPQKRVEANRELHRVT